MSLTILIADDHTLFRDALLHYIERAEDDSNAFVAKDLFEARDILSREGPFDIVLLDLRMPGMNGLEGFREIREKYPDIKLCMMSGVAEKSDVQQAIDMGANGYFPKTLSGKAMLGAIQSVLDGQTYIPFEGIDQGIMPAYRGTGIKTGGAPVSADMRSINDLNFTPREMEVLSYLVQGKSNKEIARELDLQVVTVKLHVRGVCRKLDAKNRTQAALKAQNMGFGAVEQQGTA